MKVLHVYIFKARMDVAHDYFALSTNKFPNMSFFQQISIVSFFPFTTGRQVTVYAVNSYAPRPTSGCPAHNTDRIMYLCCGVSMLGEQKETTWLNLEIDLRHMLNK